MKSIDCLPIGLYEKALPFDLSFEKKFDWAEEAGFNFIELSIDSTPGRMSRLEWGQRDINEITSLTVKKNFGFKTMALSALRKFTMGCPDKSIREKSVSIIKKATSLAAGLGIGIIQLSAYDVYRQESSALTRELFIDSLKDCVEFAERCKVILALETMDTNFIDSVEKAMQYVNLIRSDSLKIYPDNGNIAAMGYDFANDIEKGIDDIVAIHVKDTKPNVVRRVPYGEGIVDFKRDFKKLEELGYSGYLISEMWCDDDISFLPYLKKAHAFLKSQMELEEEL